MSSFSWLPNPMRTSLVSLRNQYRAQKQKRTLAAQLAMQLPLRIIVGSANRKYKGWVATDRETIDLLRKDSLPDTFSKSF